MTGFNSAFKGLLLFYLSVLICISVRLHFIFVLLFFAAFLDKI